jgi:hypothetical protein
MENTTLLQNPPNKENSPELLWNSFWKKICTNPDGSLNLEQIKKELADFHYLIQEVPKVYCEITGNKMSYPNYPANSVLQAYEDHLDEMEAEQEECDKEDGVCSRCNQEIAK